MTVGRIAGMAVVLTAVGLAVVQLRTSQVALARQAAELHRQRALLEREVWDQELTIARLRAPGLVRERLERLAAGQTAGEPQELGGSDDRMATR